MRRSRLAIGLALVGCLLSAGDARGQHGAPEVFLENDTGFFVAQIEHLGTYELDLVYEIYFRGSDEDVDLQTGVTETGLPLMETKSVSHLAAIDISLAVLQACVGDVCRPLDAVQEIKGRLGAGDPGTFVRLTVSATKRPLKQGEDLRLIASPGWVKGPALGPSPELSVTMPRLGEAGATALTSHPRLRLFVAPITEDTESDEDASSLSFEGGINSFRRSSRLGLQYNGSVSTDEEIGFNSIELNGEYERNLLAKRADYLPLKFTLGAETDQSFDLVNGVLGVSLSYLLPWNANFSPRGEGYIPNTGPLLEFKAEMGTQIEQDETNPAAAAAPEDFERAGYDFRWRLPVARATLLRIHHAGRWVFSDDTDDDLHTLWDVVLETEIGNLSYYIGFQQGEAAPLFQPTETTQVGVVIRLGDQIECTRQPGNDSHLTCG